MQNTACEMRRGDGSSDVCSSDRWRARHHREQHRGRLRAPAAPQTGRRGRYHRARLWLPNRRGPRLPSLKRRLLLGLLLALVVNWASWFAWFAYEQGSTQTGVWDQKLPAVEIGRAWCRESGCTYV